LGGGHNRGGGSFDRYFSSNGKSTQILSEP
jgi:hypothetical protein